MEELKNRFFSSHPDEPIILHRKEIMNAYPPFEVLKEGNIRENFDNALLFLLNKWEYSVLTVCLDKKRHRDTYLVWRYDPYHYCLAVLLERYHFFLKRKNVRGDVMAESRGGKEDMRLKDSFRRLWKNGTDYVCPEDFQTTLTSCDLKVKPKSANIAGLQLADLIAHPSRLDVLRGNHFKDNTLPAFGEKIINILQNKYDQDKEKLYGKKMI